MTILGWILVITFGAVILGFFGWIAKEAPSAIVIMVLAIIVALGFGYGTHLLGWT